MILQFDSLKITIKQRYTVGQFRSSMEIGEP